MPDKKNILVIKLGSLGDFVQALGPMEAIRKRHPHADITLLTTSPFVTLARECGYFDHVLVDSRPRWNDWRGWMMLYRKFNDGAFARVYDLQNSDRTSLYYKMFRRKPEWVGVARGASHRNLSPDRTSGNAFEGHRQTLKLAGIDTIRIDPMDWAKGGNASFDMYAQPFVLVVPGSSPQWPEKRWPAERYGELAVQLFKWGFLPVILGTAVESEAAGTIRAICPEALDLTGQTTLGDIIAMARHAAAAIGNDTGPMHMIGPTGCPTLVLFSGSSKPHRHAPLGHHVDFIQEADLKDLSVEIVAARLTVNGFRQAGDSIAFTHRHEH